MAYEADITETLGTVGGRTLANGYVSADAVRQQYTGYEHDDESGLDFAQARYYNSSHGRFTSVDPLTASANMKDPQTFNRYSYALNSPYKFTDPLGLIASSAKEMLAQIHDPTSGAVESKPDPFGVDAVLHAPPEVGDDNPYSGLMYPTRYTDIFSGCS